MSILNKLLLSNIPYYMIPNHEIELEFSRASGPGGQNINKTATKVVVRWSILKTSSLTAEQKQRLKLVLKKKINNDGEVVVSASEERSQLQNRNRAVARLNQMVAQALIIKKKRRATKPTYSSKLKRLTSKKQRSQVKKARKAIE